VWQLENQQGYTDGIQFEFADVDRGGSVSVQLVAIGGSLDTGCVVPVRIPSGTPQE
jgi:hypothetical protein